MRRHLAYNQPTDFLRRRDFSQKMEATFDFIRAHATPLVRVLVVLVLPLALLTGIGVSLIQSQVLSMLTGLASQNVGNASAGGLSSLPIMPEVFTSATFWLTILSGILLLAVLHLVVLGYMVLQAERTTDEPVTAADVWQLVKARFWGMVGSFIGLGFVFFVIIMVVGGILFALGALLKTTWLAILLGIALYIGIIYAIVPLSLYFIVWLREGRGFFGSLTRSFQLTWGKWWSTFGLMIVISIITSMIMFVVVMALSLIGMPFSGLASSEATEPTATARVMLIVYTILSSVIRLVLYPLLLIALSFQYFNLVERHDGTGTRLMVDAIGEPAPAVAPQGLRPDDEGEY